VALLLTADDSRFRTRGDPPACHRQFMKAFASHTVGQYWNCDDRPMFRLQAQDQKMRP
jgi:hypothetical protein